MAAGLKGVRIGLSGKAAVVTGGSHGLGRSIVLALARHGASVAFTYSKDKAEADTTVRAAKGLAGSVMGFPSDATDFLAAGRTIRRVAARFGRIDILVNNVGGSGREEGPIWTMTEREWDRVIALNLKSAFNYTRAVCPIFISQQRGTIVNLGSINGLRGREGQPAYSSAKAALVGFTKTLAKELGLYQVNVNMVASGYLDTEKSQSTVKEVHRRSILNACAIRHLTHPDELATLVTFLCSDAARYLTGTIIKLDSGEYM